MIDLRLVRGSTTGEQLKALLQERGVRIGTEGAGGVVSYGVRVESSTLPCLNLNAGKLNKFEELQQLSAMGIPVPLHALDGAGLKFPVLGRKFKHSKGRDIVPVLAADSTFGWAKTNADYFTEYIPLNREFRVWSYRKRKLAVYEKVMERPADYRKVGCNWQNGTVFTFVREPEARLMEIGTAAVDAVELDFGAVDILQSMDGNYYVLEVNTAPGQEGIRQGLIGLADKIARWESLGYPRRRGSTNAE